MDIFLKITAGILISAVLCVVLSKQGAEISLVLCLVVCSMVLVASFAYFSPVLEFARRLMRVGNVNSELMQVLFKAVGIGLLSQIVGLICDDVGKKSLGKVLQIAATSLILCICIPVLEQLLELIEMVLGEL